MKDFKDSIDNDATIQDDFELQELTSGVTLCGKYRLEKEAGAGGMGVVWKAWDEVGERWVALKFVPPEIRHSDGAMAQVKTVFQTVQALNHTNIGPVYGLEKDPTLGYFIVKKWLDGQTLDKMKLPLDRIPGVLAKVADALDYAHSKRVMHRDVKPSNIFIEKNGDVFLIDFGIAAEIQNSISLNTSSTVCRTSGTRLYMAPEQWKGQQQDGQTDQYALGVVAYQLYSGHLPFEIHDPLLLRMAVLQDQPESLENVPPAVNAAIQRALSKGRKDRFATCREFIGAFTKEGPKPQTASVSQKANTAAAVKPDSQNQSTNRSSFYWSGTKIQCFTGKETSVVIPEGTTEIERAAFGECHFLTSVVIPEGVTVIGEDAFAECISLMSVEIPSSVTVIGREAFAGCSSLTSVVIPEGVKEIGYEAFAECSSLTSVSIPESVMELGEKAFCNCGFLKSVVLPRDLKVVEPSTFSGCSSLESVVIPQGVKVIGGNAFYNCSSLTSVEIPDSVTVIGDGVFSGCHSLMSVVIPKSVAKIGKDAFKDCPKLAKESPKESTAEKHSANKKSTIQTPKPSMPKKKSTSLSSFQIYEKELYKFIGNETEVVIPEGVTRIADQAFFDCSFVKSVVIPAGVREIGGSAFCNCISLKSVVIPEGVTKIGSQAFRGCRSLTSVVIPKGVMLIQKYAFLDCKSLRSVVLPEGVKIEEFAFSGCPVPWFSKAWWHK